MKPLQKNETPTLSKLVSNQLKQYIIDQQLAAGDKLPSERDLVKLLGVSRSVLREALCYLEVSGIVSIRQGEGTYVQEHDLTPLMDQLIYQWRRQNLSMKDLLDLRIILELSAVELILSHASEEDLTQLEQITAQMNTAGAEESLENHTAFHRLLLKATHNEFFIQVTDMIIQYSTKLFIANSNEIDFEKLTIDHQQIINALRNKNESLAKELLRIHLTDFFKHHSNTPIT